MKVEEKLAQYPQLQQIAPNGRRPKEVSSKILHQIFLEHTEKFDQEYKQKLF